MQQLERAVHFDRLDALGELAPEDAQVHAREVRAQAEVFAHAEAEVRVRVAVDAEHVGVREHVLVAVGRRVEERHRVSGADPAAAQLVVLRRGAREVVDGRGPAHDLVGRGADQRGVAPELLELGGVLEEGAQARRDRVPRGVVAGHHDQEVERVELELRRRIAVGKLGVREHRAEVLARVAAPVLHHLVEVLEGLGDEGEPLLRRVARELEVRILDAEVLVGDLQHPLLALARDAEHLGDHAQRLERGHVAHEVAAAPAAVSGQLVEDLGRDLFEALLEPRDRTRREPVRNEPPVVAMLGRVHVDEHAQGRRLLQAVAARTLHLREQDEAARAAEDLRLLRDLDDVGVLGDRPERLVAGWLHPVHRRLAAQPAPRLVRVAVLAVELGGDHVQLVERDVPDVLRSGERRSGHRVALHPIEGDEE